MAGKCLGHPVLWGHSFKIPSGAELRSPGAVTCPPVHMALGFPGQSLHCHSCLLSRALPTACTRVLPPPCLGWRGTPTSGQVLPAPRGARVGAHHGAGSGPAAAGVPGRGQAEEEERVLNTHANKPPASKCLAKSLLSVSSFFSLFSCPLWAVRSEAVFTSLHWPYLDLPSQPPWLAPERWL